MTIEKLYPSGGYLVSDIIDGQLVKRRYYGYTKKESVRMFKHDIKHETKQGKTPAQNG